MPRPCSICINEQRAEIDDALMRGDSYRVISQIYNVSPDAVSRHKKNAHIGKEIVEVHQAEIIERSGDLWSQIDFWSKEIEAIYQEAKQKHEKTVALNAIEKALKLVALTSQIKAMSGDAPHETEIDPVAGAHLVMEYLREHCPEVIEGLVKHLNEQYELYGARMIPGPGIK